MVHTGSKKKIKVFGLIHLESLEESHDSIILSPYKLRVRVLNWKLAGGSLTGTLRGLDP